MNASIKSTGIVRRVDELGRIVIPKELRKKFGIDERDSLEIFVDNNMIILKKYEPFCIFCGNAQDIFTFEGRNICSHCADKLQNFIR